jgi:periplasmic divalent cation tolerance protein
MTKTFQVVTTAGTKADAQQIARAVVEKRLAGCVQIIGPITSTYWWQGEIETAEE